MARVLVVDDEPLVAAMTRRALQGEHQVEVSHTGHDALARIDRGEVFDVVLADLQMPGLDGIALRVEIAARDPALAARMIFVTGGASTAQAKAFLTADGVRSLQKPFRAEELLRLVAAAQRPSR